MLSVAIHKDIAEYQPKVIGKLTGRTLISITVALGLSISVAVYMNLVLKIDPTDHLEFIYAVSLPCWCCGFWKPHGLPFEQFALLWLQHQLSDNRLFYKPSMFKSGFVKTPDEITQSRKGKLYDKSTRKFLDGTNGLEAYSPSRLISIIDGISPPEWCRRQRIVSHRRHSISSRRDLPTASRRVICGVRFLLSRSLVRN